MNRTIIATALALALTFSAGTAAFAWHGWSSNNHNSSSYHGEYEHNGHRSAMAPQGQTVAYNQHGGGHEQGGDNAAIHDREMNDPRHQDGNVQGANLTFEQHGGGHEQAANNAELHQREMQNPNHRD